MIICLIIAICLSSVSILTSLSVIFSLFYWQVTISVVQNQPSDQVPEPALSSPAGSPAVPRKRTAAPPSPPLEAAAPADPWNTHERSSRKPSIMAGASRSKLSAVPSVPLGLENPLKEILHSQD